MSPGKPNSPTPLVITSRKGYYVYFYSFSHIFSDSRAQYCDYAIIINVLAGRCKLINVL